ncbi:DNA-directed RNA polymerase II subunit rpb1 [Ceratobasidium sp. 428]|nr:DNA-directed RNA polymerase II subunit rpb1 [Ceratobasidium sp. 428]
MVLYVTGAGRYPHRDSPSKESEFRLVSSIRLSLILTRTTIAPSLVVSWIIYTSAASFGEDGMDGAFVERQSFEPYRLSHRAFELKYRIDVLEAGSGFSTSTLQVGIDATSPELQYTLDRAFAQLTEDRRLLRVFIFRNISKKSLRLCGLTQTT